MKSEDTSSPASSSHQRKTEENIAEASQILEQLREVALHVLDYLRARVDLAKFSFKSFIFQSLLSVLVAISSLVTLLMGVMFLSYGIVFGLVSFFNIQVWLASFLSGLFWLTFGSFLFRYFFWTRKLKCTKQIKKL
ncbi:MAG: hypothetical protein A3C46_00140 [Deltaproteobacteria bacterium RIFCSPHIGHO2_02_FULL_44_16]|nr:MAG: hypothetical protein A3C46_00140 [Deltaproteobacteria bacterium RIFCSPHIGHO2_02_FULL_44_16]